MTRRVLEVGFSPCPNDTFMFHALVHGLVVVPGVEFRPVLADIEELNARASGAQALPLTKMSIGALAATCDRYSVLRSGAALGRGVGPLIVARNGGAAPGDIRGLAGRRVAIPGERTTAFLLLQLFGPPGIEPVEMRFDRILPAVVRGEVDAGLVIHESRFTYAEHGLVSIADVGQIWGETSGLPLPLGVIAARRSLPAREVEAVDRALRVSVQLALTDPDASRAFVKAHAQELSDEVCDRHIGLYVNEFSVDLGEQGRAAIDELVQRGRAEGLLSHGGSVWR